jgi:hypothetical protein
MTTNNPKISAYVPQAVYDRFEQFRKESGLSMSQSAIVIFAKYFGLEDIANGVAGEITTDNSALDRIKILESQVDDLYKKFSELEDESSSELSSPIVLEETKEASDSLSEDIPSEPLNELPIQKGDTPSLSLDGLQGELLSEPLAQVQINPIRGNILARRLIQPEKKEQIPESKLSTENKKSIDHFYQWTMSLDIDHIGWEYKGRKIGYIPVGELSSELHSKLLKWIQENS